MKASPTSNFKKDSTITLFETAVAEFAQRKSANQNNMTISILVAANKSLKTKKPVFVVSNYTGWHIVTKLNSTIALNGYVEVDGYSATKYIPVYG